LPSPEWGGERVHQRAAKDKKGRTQKLATEKIHGCDYFMCELV